MGLLDDAIREHLDLKRRRGADPAEIERAERDALGPVRRGPEEPLAPEPDAGEAAAFDQEREWSEPFDGADQFEAEEESHKHGLVLESPIAEAPPAHDRPPLPAEEWDHEEPFEEEEPPAPASAASPAPHAAPPEPSHHLSDETAEYHVEDELGKEEKHGEDVLEETPEFLQDTPDHDRLWFEQRPPRDFDFDK